MSDVLNCISIFLFVIFLLSDNATARRTHYYVWLSNDTKCTPIYLVQILLYDVYVCRARVRRVNAIFFFEHIYFQVQILFVCFGCNGRLEILFKEFDSKALQPFNIDTIAVFIVQGTLQVRYGILHRKRSNQYGLLTEMNNIFAQK